MKIVMLKDKEITGLVAGVPLVVRFEVGHCRLNPAYRVIARYFTRSSHIRRPYDERSQNEISKGEASDGEQAMVQKMCIGI